MRRNTGRARAAELRFYRHAVEETHAAIDDAAAAADDGGDASSLHVVVEVQRARGLAAVDKKGHAHPFCAITLVEATTGKALPKPHHKASRTRVVKGTTAPSWETTPERFAFDGVPVGAAGPPKLRVDVLSYTSVLSAPKPLGRASVSLAGLGPAAAALWLRLEPFGSLKAATGEVLIKVSTRHSHAVGDVPEEVLDAEAARWFVDEPVVADPLHTHPPNCLRVAVVRGRGLRAMDGKGVASSLLGTGRGGSSDPYVTVGTKRFVAKTKVQAKTLDPVWMEAFELEYDAGDAWLRLRVDDSDVAGHEFMGSGLVKLSELPPSHDDDGSATAFWVTLIDGDCGHDDRRRRLGGVRAPHALGPVPLERRLVPYVEREYFQAHVEQAEPREPFPRAALDAARGARGKVARRRAAPRAAPQAHEVLGGLGDGVPPADLERLDRAARHLLFGGRGDVGLEDVVLLALHALPPRSVALPGHGRSIALAVVHAGAVVPEGRVVVLQGRAMGELLLEVGAIGGLVLEVGVLAAPRATVLAAARAIRAPRAPRAMVLGHCVSTRPSAPAQMSCPENDVDAAEQCNISSSAELSRPRPSKERVVALLTPQ